VKLVGIDLQGTKEVHLAGHQCCLGHPNTPSCRSARCVTATPFDRLVGLSVAS
jgi:hypothetical protein